MLPAPLDAGKAHQDLFNRLAPRLAEIATIAQAGGRSVNHAYRSVAKLKPLYEHVNLGHHEALCIAALEQLQGQHPGLEWRWNPSNRGKKNEADLQGRNDKGDLVAAAECSAAISAIGTLGGRMKKAVAKLGELKAMHQYYFVATEKLERAAERVVHRGGLPIQVVRVDLDAVDVG